MEHQSEKHPTHDTMATPAPPSSAVDGKTSPEEIALVRKLDWRLMPMLWFMYWFNYLDRNAITVARLDGLEKELGLSSTQYQTCVSILFVGYIIGQIPSNMLITRLRPSYYMAGAMALWSIISALTAITHDYKGMVLTRFFLGIAEAPFYPGALYMVASFYTKDEIATRMSILFTANICGTAFAGLLAIGVFEMSGLHGISGWRWLFILFGVVSFVFAVASAWVLPDEPYNTRWLSEDERRLAASRMEADTTELKANTSTWRGLLDAVKDARLWVLIFMQHLHLAASGYKNFFPSIVETLGFSRNVTLALTCPPYLIAGGFCILWAWSSGRYNERVWHITVAKTIAVIGFVLACATLNTGARYFAMCTFATGVYACNSIIMGWVSSTCGQNRERKSISMGIVNCIATIAAVYTPYLWPSSDAPRFVTAMATNVGFSISSAILAWVLRWMLIRENRRLALSPNDDGRRYAY
ncbi:major facilitator superfamily domain-containing protein [Plectosphaerella plurivora]|uniref:Major facilitator superfamily domain-containing protein n=1 Tax=Plectosphaerella plurivora TaxID=936078 RepID=A0A9P8V427_9PEZI|nr:major facilitator superfamily domain-containing protein [Plectosphaerella plurivora]